MRDHLLAKYLTSSLYTYCEEGIGFDLYQQPHRLMTDVYERALPPAPENMKAASQKYVMTLWPRETLKTSIGCQGLVEYFALKWKIHYGYDVRILIVRSTREASQAVLGAVEQDLSTINPVLQRAFGNLASDSTEWSENGATLNWRSTAYREPTFDTAATGVSRTGYHYDLVIVDDIANENNYESEVEMLKASRYIAALVPVLASWGSILVIGTRWGFNDPYGNIIDLNTRRQAAGKSKLWDIHCTGYRLDDGSLFYPDYLTEDRVRERREVMNAMTGSDKLWMASYLNVVTTDESAVFKKSEQRFYDGTYYPRSDMPAHLAISSGNLRGNSIPVDCAIHIDPATAVTDKANKTGIAVVLTDKEGNRWVHDSWEGKELPADLVSRVLALTRFYMPSQISIDVLGQQVLWADMALRPALHASGLDDVIVTKYRGVSGKGTGTGNKGPLAKAKRIENLGLLFREGRIFLHEGRVRPVVHALDTYNGVTSTNHFDILDALSHTMTVARFPSAERYSEDLEAREEKMMEDGEPPSPKRKVAGTYAGKASHAKIR